MNEELIKYLDEKFQIASKEREEFNTRLENIEVKTEEFNTRLENIEVKTASLEVDMKEVRADIKETKDIINQLFNRIDRFLAILEKLDQEFTIMKEDIRRMKKVIKEKLGVDLS